MIVQETSFSQHVMLTEKSLNHYYNTNSLCFMITITQIVYVL